VTSSQIRFTKIRIDELVRNVDKILKTKNVSQQWSASRSEPIPGVAE
jgi:hypothetical protein